MSSEITGKTKTLGLRAPERLTDDHDISQLDCNEESINKFLKDARKHTKMQNCVFYVACIIDTNIVKAYYTLSNGSVLRNEAPTNMRRLSMGSLPVTILGRLGVDKEFQGEGVGLDLLRDALERSMAAAKIIGSRAVLVHALDQRLADFYKKHAGFVASPITALTLFFAL